MIPASIAMMFSQSAPISFSVYGTASVLNSSTLTLPAGVTTGDYIVVVTQDSGGTSTPNIATGFTSIATGATGSSACRSSFLNVTSNPSSIAGLSLGPNIQHLAVVFRGTAVPTALLTGAGSTTGGTAPIAPPTIAVAGGQIPCLVICVVGIKSNSPSLTAPSLFTLSGRFAGSTGTVAIAHKENHNNTTIPPATFTNAVSEKWIAFTVALTDTP